MKSTKARGGRFARGGLVAAFLRVPLRVKLAGANILLLTAFALVIVAHGTGVVSRSELFATVGAVLLGSLLLNIALVRLALTPLEDVESTAARVWRGDFDARVVASPLADEDMRRVGNTINLLLDRLDEERSRIRDLAAQVIRAGDQERARIARELHDSTAQTLAALALQTTSALQLAQDPELQGHLELIRSHAVDALEEVRTLSHTVHPRVLDDLGLRAALEALGRQIRQAHEIDVSVESTGDIRALSPTLASVLYTIAQEAVTNSVRHGAPRSIQLRLDLSDEGVRLEIVDDGRGFEHERGGRPSSKGLFAMTERAALVDGEVHIDSLPGRGTRIVATIPHTPAQSVIHE